MQSIGQKAGCSTKPEWTDLGKRSAWNLGNLTLPNHAGARAHSLALLAPLYSEAVACVIQVISDLLDRLPSHFFLPPLHSFTLLQPAWALWVWYPAEESVRSQGAKTSGMSPASVFIKPYLMQSLILLSFINHSKSVVVSRFKDTLQTMSSYLLTSLKQMRKTEVTVLTCNQRRVW